MSSPIFYIIELTAKDGMLDTVVARLTDAAKRVEEEEPGVVTYSFYKDADASKVYAHEGFDSSESLVEHFGGPIVAEWMPKILEVADPTRVTVFGEPTPEAAEALGRMGATFASPAAGFVR